MSPEIPPKKTRKIRADQLLHEQGLAESRERAKRLIMAGQALMDRNGTAVPIDKPGQQLAPETVLSLKGKERFVSRGGHKLLTALEAFSLDVSGLTCLDAGAATGGFTDCLLQHGAKLVYAVDVGKAQLHESLLRDERVVSMEGVNLRHAEPDLLPEQVDLAVADLSFISLTLVLGPMANLVKDGGQLIVLVKPQFELGPEANVKGVVRDDALRQKAVDLVIEHARSLGLTDRGVVPSAIKGPKGNQEFCLLLQKSC